MKYMFAAGLAAGVFLNAGLALSGSSDTDDSNHDPVEIRLIMPKMDAELGRELFVSKGCVACHSVNDVGGDFASPLDAHDMEPYMNPFDLAARMWRMAPFMIAAQEEVLGEQIQFDGDELSAIIAFLHDDAEQHELSLDGAPVGHN